MFDSRHVVTNPEELRDLVHHPAQLNKRRCCRALMGTAVVDPAKPVRRRLQH